MGGLHRWWRRIDGRPHAQLADGDSTEGPWNTRAGRPAGWDDTTPAPEPTGTGARVRLRRRSYFFRLVAFFLATFFAAFFFTTFLVVFFGAVPAVPLYMPASSSARIRFASSMVLRYPRSLPEM